MLLKERDIPAVRKSCCRAGVESDAADMEAFLAEPWEADPSKTVKDALVEKVAVRSVRTLKSVDLRR